jgi:hypothetical protein
VLAELDRKLDGHPLQNELNRLSEARKKKSVSKVEIDRLNDIHGNANVTIGNK